MREFAAALATMDSLRQELAASLNSQWHAEALRRRQLAALAHDLKTPLTVISGNAELLCEDGLACPAAGAGAGHCAQRGRAQQYVDSLRAVAALAAQKEERAETPAAPLFAACAGTRRPCVQKTGCAFSRLCRRAARQRLPAPGSFCAALC